ncbi:mitochondrial hydrolase YKR070W isoform X2 [Oryza sativa Japonica Group]|uniref:mitochondrial hydrolase YKR070W isoform X2 n=1 Tax=Oryza sativa subsp. japonica TaxID=39947 RepID=UPI0007753755|nr:uncharacterized protein YKR070W isoform X2 [Oryza sativa Japonica Group]KAF2938679.1 hypothetical protein DAI22_03g135500 [Oryza sativa Japonica Group]
MKGFRAALARASARSRAELQVARRRRHPSDPARRLSHSGTAPARPSFGIAFDIDGVILRGRSPIGGSPQAIRRLYSEDGTLKIPFLFLTNGGGVPEHKRAQELSELLGVNISPAQVVHGSSPYKELVNRFENDLIIAVGKGEPAAVMVDYGFRKVLSIDEYSSYFGDIDPLAPFKKWIVQQPDNINLMSEKVHPSYDVFEERVKGVFVVSDPVDWGRDLQVLCDILSTGGLPGSGRGDQPPLYFASDDLEYQAAFPSERLGMGAFRIALESIFNQLDPLGHLFLQGLAYLGERIMIHSILLIWLLILLRMPLTVFWKRNVYSDRVTLVLSIHAPFIVIWHAFCATPLFCLAILEQLLAGVPSLIHSTCLSWDIRKYADAL